jgi:DNA-directed RNA polymerase specialized sigma24 family protein
MFAITLRTAQEQFTVAMPQIAAAARYCFRRWRPQDRAEAIAETQAAAWHGLVARGQDPVAVGIAGIAHNACRYVRNGRRLGTGSCGRGVMDVYHRKAQAACGFKVLSLDYGDEINARPTIGSLWRQWVAAASRVGPAANAAFRLDFSAWLEELPKRKRQMAELLALGHETSDVARMLGVSVGAVSQTRRWLEASWKVFQGQTDPAPERPAPAQSGVSRRRVRPRRAERDPAGGSG